MEDTLKNIKGSSGSSQTDSAIDMMDEEGYIGKAFYDFFFIAASGPFSNAFVGVWLKICLGVCGNGNRHLQVPSRYHRKPCPVEYAPTARATEMRRIEQTEEAINTYVGKGDGQGKADFEADEGKQNSSR